MSFNNLQGWQNWDLTKPDKFMRAVRLVLAENPELIRNGGKLLLLD